MLTAQARRSDLPLPISTKEIRTFLQQRLTDGRALLDSPGGAAQQIHACRKLIRALRADLHLLRHALSRSTAADWDRRLRLVAHALSPLRDQEMLIERLTEWTQDEAWSAHDRRALARLRRWIRSTLPHDPTSSQRVLDRARGTLEILGRQLQHEHLRGGWRRVLRGHIDTLRREHRAWKALRQDPDGSGWHRWRRRCKDLDQQLRSLGPLCPPVQSGWRKAWHAVSDLVGVVQDGALLDQALDRYSDIGTVSDPDRSSIHQLRRIISGHQHQARAAAMDLGYQLHAQPLTATHAQLTVWFRLRAQGSSD